MTAWGAFVGLFLARISRGRTIRQVALFSFIAPLVYAFIWFCTFGGIGLRQARTAEELEFYGAEIFGDPAHFRVNGSDVCYNVPQEDIVNQTSGEVVWSNTVPGVTPVCQKAAAATDDWFNVMFSFSFKVQEDFAGFGGFMAGLSLIALTIYFVTSSDSGSLIVDHLASNGHEDHHWLQRVFWAFTEGAVATALLMAGGGSALNALQAASIVFALPFVSTGSVEVIYQAHSISFDHFSHTIAACLLHWPTELYVVRNDVLHRCVREMCVFTMICCMLTFSLRHDVLRSANV
jgi:choline-glycine betaine transporter